MTSVEEGTMTAGWIKRLGLPLLLLFVLAACQTGPNPRNAAYGAGAASSYGYGGYGYGGYGYGGCGYNPCKPRRICPPGHILVRIPYSYGGPGRLCKPYVRPCCKAPPPCGWPGPGPCGGYTRPIY
ncbi:MAG: hypothetical protein AAF543_19490 [Pseudomonadota bacterium]